jgi:copper chaperone CopZ
MKTRYILTLIVAFALSFTACKNEGKKADTKEVQTEATIAKMETVSLNISGMMCEIGCAKTIQSKLSKKDGVASAKVIFQDSLATVQFDANKTSSDELITLINGIAGGDHYIATEAEEVAADK